MVEVEFITLGDASEKLGVPAPTLRHWTDQLEEFGVHYVLRNNRNERIYYDTDLEIFAFLRDLKSEFGRKTTTKDLAYMIAEKAKEGRFKVRSKEDVPDFPNTNKTAELLGHEDIKRLMESERVKQFIGIIIGETAKNLHESIVEEVKEVVRQELRQEMEERNKKMEEVAQRMEENIKRRIEQTDKFITELREQRKNRGFFSKLFGK